MLIGQLVFHFTVSKHNQLKFIKIYPIGQLTFSSTINKYNMYTFQ